MARPRFGDLVLVEKRRLERGKLAQSRGQGGQPRVSNLVIAQVKVVERGQRPLGEGGGERSGGSGG